MTSSSTSTPGTAKSRDEARATGPTRSLRSTRSGTPLVSGWSVRRGAFGLPDLARATGRRPALGHRLRVDQAGWVTLLDSGQQCRVHGHEKVPAHERAARP